MRAVDLNFASSPFRNNTPYYLGYGLGVLALAAFTSYNVYAFMTYSKNQTLLETDYAQKKTRLEALYEQSGKLTGEITKRDIASLNERAKFTNDLLDRRRFSWTALLNSLEEVQPYQVRLLSLRPIIQPKGILIDARAVAKDLQAYWNFQQNLMRHEKFRRQYPAGYLKSDEAGDIIFNLAFNYFPDGAPAEFGALTPEEAGMVQAPGSNPGGLGEDDLKEVEGPIAPPLRPPASALGSKPGLHPPPANRPPAGAVPVPPATIVQHPPATGPRGASPGPPSAREGVPSQPPGVRLPPASPQPVGQIVGGPSGQLTPPAPGPVPGTPGTIDRSKMRPSRVPLQGSAPPPPPEEPKRRRIPLDSPPPSEGDATSEDDNP